MKKIIALILILLMFISTAYAQSYDFSKFSDDDIYTLYNELISEMKNRGLAIGAKKTLSTGIYVIGKDLEPGVYSLTCVSSDDEAFGDLYSALGNMSSLDDEFAGLTGLFGAFGGIVDNLASMNVEIVGDFGSVLKSYEIKVGDTITVSLTEGTALKTSNGTCEIVSDK